MEYVEKTLGVGAGATNELIIQTPRRQTNSAGSILTPDALLAHLDVIKTASQVVVEKEDVTWQLKDLCYELTAPITDITVIDQVSTFFICIKKRHNITIKKRPFGFFHTRLSRQNIN